MADPTELGLSLLEELRPDGAALIRSLTSVVGRRHILRGAAAKRFSGGYRFGGGPVLAVVRPGSLVELWRALTICVAAGRIIIMQAANTGLTGGSTPDGEYDREVVLINTLRLSGIHLIENGGQVVCLPGATLYGLEQKLRPLKREPHSVIGSSCVGASVVGGVCNNSGGSLVSRGPAYTELALFARQEADGSLVLVNHLGIILGDEPEAMLTRLEAGEFSPAETIDEFDRAASDRDYPAHVRAIDEATPARFNADLSRLFEASGSAGKIAVFAVRLDTFPAEPRTKTFYIGTNDTNELTRLRRDMLSTFGHLPIAAEYIHREAFDVAADYGKDTVLAIERLGTEALPKMFAVKARVDSFARQMPFLPDNLSELAMQAASGLFRDHLPARMRQYRDDYEHHLLLKMGGEGCEEALAYLTNKFPSKSGDFFLCSEGEANKAFLHRFAVAGAAVRYRAVHHRSVEDIVALDIALPRNCTEWFERLPSELDKCFVKKLYYGHFFCQVFHHDYIVRKGTDVLSLEHALWQLLDARGAEYPAEHNVGHLYRAKPVLADHYRELDPYNNFNPGIGGGSRHLGWR